MQEKFQWGKFILDCFLCFGLMVVSSIVFFYPISWILNIVDKSASFTATAIIIILFVLFCYCIIYFLLGYKPNRLGYKPNRLSCIFSFVLLILFSIYIDIVLKFYFIK